MGLRIGCISDTHTQHRDINMPECDVIISAGDESYRGELDVLRDFVSWMHDLPVKHRLMIGGNHSLSLREHDRRYDDALRIMRDAGVIYLHEKSIELEGLLFYGANYSPTFGYGWAFNVDRGKPIAEKWVKIPNDVNVLVTHSPPYMINDELQEGGHAGCEELTKRLDHLPKLKLSVAGHLHFAHGHKIINSTHFVNAACCTDAYKPTNPPIVIEL